MKQRRIVTHYEHHVLLRRRAKMLSRRVTEQMTEVKQMPAL